MGDSEKLARHALGHGEFTCPDTTSDWRRGTLWPSEADLFRDYLATKERNRELAAENERLRAEAPVAEIPCPFGPEPRRVSAFVSIAEDGSVTPCGPMFEVPSPANGVPILLGHDAARERIDAANGILAELLPPAVSDRVIVDGREVVVPRQSRIESVEAFPFRPREPHEDAAHAIDRQILAKFEPRKLVAMLKAEEEKVAALERENVSLRSDVAKWKAERDALMADAVRERRSNR